MSNLPALLSAFPALTHFHLVGSSFFGSKSSPDALSKLSETSLLFDHLELTAVLSFLRDTSVTLFTYRGQDEKREMKWIRSDRNQKFDRDCWTL